MALSLSYPFQESAGNHTVDDVSASNNNGTASANTSTLHVAGPGGTLTGAFDMTPNADNVALTSDITLSSANSWTVQFFYKDGDGESDEGILGQIGSFAGIWFGGTAMLVETDDETRVSFTITRDTSWHHWAIVNTNGATAPKLYRDGVLLGSFDGPLGGNLVIDHIGVANGGDSSYVIYGIICCDNCVYDTARTQPQILADKLLGLPVAATSHHPRQIQVVTHARGFGRGRGGRRR